MAEPERIDWPSTVRPRLSTTAAEFLRQHPAEAEQIVAAALETAARQSAPEPELTEDEAAVAATLAGQRPTVPPALQRFVVTPHPREGEWLTATEAAERLQLSRESVYAWIKSHRLLAWSRTRQGVVIPAEQILGPGDVVPGMARVLEVLPDARSAWRFLTEESFFLEPPQRPLDLLKAGRIDEVVNAANADTEAFT
jgi:excisionase family DNA binding protein